MRAARGGGSILTLLILLFNMLTVHDFVLININKKYVFISINEDTVVPKGLPTPCRIC